MSDQFPQYNKLPAELQTLVFEQARPIPGAHFLKPFRNYNGSLSGEAFIDPYELCITDQRELGVQEVSPLSAACETAKLEMVPWGIDESIRLRNLTAIALNPAVPMFPNNRLGAPLGSVPQIRVNMDNDIFCVSSNGQEPWFPGEKFTGGNVLQHRVLNNMRRIAFTLPLYDRAYNTCEDCGRDFSDQYFFNHRLEYCKECVGFWPVGLHKLEQAYLIVPGLARAQATDQRHVFRYGMSADVRAAVAAQTLLGGRPVWDRSRNIPPGASGRPGCILRVTRTIEDFGTAKPEVFHGNGITLHEVAASAVPLRALHLMWAMFDRFWALRSFFTLEEESDGQYNPVPAQPLICGGLVEFKFLSYTTTP